MLDLTLLKFKPQMPSLRTAAWSYLTRVLRGEAICASKISGSKKNKLGFKILVAQIASSPTLHGVIKFLSAIRNDDYVTRSPQYFFL